MTFLLCLCVVADPVAKPATLAEVRKSIDWLTFPKPEGAVYEETGFLTTKYVAPGTTDTIAEWTRKTMTAAGWAEEQRPYRETDPEKYRTLIFTKNGFVAQQNLRFLTQSVEVNWRNVGNVDARQLPKLDKAEGLASDRTYLYYTTPTKPGEAIEFYRKELTALGWRESPKLSAEAIAKGGRLELRFVQNAMECRVAVGKDEKGAGTVSCFTAVRESLDPADFAVKPVPTPADEKTRLEALDLSKFPRIGDGEHKGKSKLLAEYTARTSVDKGVAFYRKAFAEKGWTQVPPLVDVFERGELHFEKDGVHASVELRRTDKNGLRTIVVQNLGNVDTRHLAHPPGAELPPLRQPAYFIKVPARPAEVEKFYLDELPKLGWAVKSKSDLSFTQNGVALRFYVGTPRNGLTPVQVTLVSER